MRSPVVCACAKRDSAKQTSRKTRRRNFISRSFSAASGPATNPFRTISLVGRGKSCLVRRAAECRFYGDGHAQNYPAIFRCLDGVACPGLIVPQRTNLGRCGKKSLCRTSVRDLRRQNKLCHPLCRLPWSECGRNG